MRKKKSQLLPEPPPGISAEVRCPICGALNAWMRYCQHVRWTFDQGGPLDFARFAIETSPYIRGRGYDPDVVPDMWFNARGGWIVEQVEAHFEAVDGYVFGYIGDLDMLTLEIWQAYHPDPERRPLPRV